MRSRRTLLALTIAAASMAWSSPTAQAFGDAATFARFVDDYFDARFAAHPSEGTAAGLHQYDGRLEDLSREKVEARVSELKAQLARLGRDAGDSFDDRIDAGVLDGQIRSELLELETLRTWEVNPMAYAGLAGGSIDGLMKRDFAPPAARLRSVIARERAIPAVFEAARANLKNPPKEFTDLAIRMAKGSVGFFKGSVATWARDAAGGDAGSSPSSRRPTPA